MTGLSGVTSIATGNRDTCAVLRDGSARCWGSNDSGELGDGTTQQHAAPIPVRGLHGVEHIVAGVSRSCALLTDHTVHCWGDIGSGRLAGAAVLTPQLVSGLAAAATVAGFGQHVCILLDDGAARCWGVNDAGQLGDDTRTTRPDPVAVAGVG